MNNSAYCCHLSDRLKRLSTLFHNHKRCWLELAATDMKMHLDESDLSGLLTDDIDIDIWGS